MSNDYYKIGSHNVLCDNCAKKFKREQVRKTWDGFMMCIKRCWYPKHPNEFPRQVPNDGLPVDDARPREVASRWTYLPVQPITQWETAGLTWETPDWRWDDDPSQSELFYNGNP